MPTSAVRPPGRTTLAVRAVHRRDVDAEEIHARRADEGGDELVRRRVVKLERRADLRDDTLVEHDDLVGEGHRLRLVMRHIDHRRAEIGVELRQFEAHLHAQFGVEVGQRLVEQENLGLAHQRAADRDPLALAARKLGRTAIEIRLELQDARDLERPLVLRLSRLRRRPRARRRCSASPSCADRARRTGTPWRCAAAPAACRSRPRCR